MSWIKEKILERFNTISETEKALPIALKELEDLKASHKVEIERLNTSWSERYWYVDASEQRFINRYTRIDNKYEQLKVVIFWLGTYSLLVTFLIVLVALKASFL